MRFLACPFALLWASARNDKSLSCHMGNGGGSPGRASAITHSRQPKGSIEIHRLEKLSPRLGGAGSPFEGG